MAKVVMDTNDPKYISEMIETILSFHPARVQSPEAMAIVWGNKMMALSNLAVANELSEIRKVLTKPTIQEVLKTMGSGGFPERETKDA